MESEKVTEAYLRDQVKARGGRSYKWVSPGCSGVPDRIVVRPDGGVFFVETKSEGETSTRLQKKRHAELREMGCRVYADIDTKAKVDEILQQEFGGLGGCAARHARGRGRMLLEADGMPPSETGRQGVTERNEVEGGLALPLCGAAHPPLELETEACRNEVFST